MVRMMRAVNEEDWGEPEWPGYWRHTSRYNEDFAYFVGCFCAPFHAKWGISPPARVLSRFFEYLVYFSWRCGIWWLAVPGGPPVVMDPLLSNPMNPTPVQDLYQLIRMLLPANFFTSMVHTFPTPPPQPKT